jgi:hypothetical protein
MINVVLICINMVGLYISVNGPVNRENSSIQQL